MVRRENLRRDMLGPPSETPRWNSSPMKSLLLHPILWIASLLFVVLANVVFALDDARIRRITRRLQKA